MKKIFLMAALIATMLIQPLFAQESKSTPLSPLLTNYYSLKNALIASNNQEAAASSAAFKIAIGSVDMKSLPATDMDSFMSVQEKLTFDAGHIAESKDIAQQREHFANLSANLFKLAKAIKLTDQVVYYDYCPMKKSYWLSAEAPIKNPYYGNQMLTCGKVSETLNK